MQIAPEKNFNMLDNSRNYYQSNHTGSIIIIINCEGSRTGSFDNCNLTKWKNVRKKWNFSIDLFRFSNCIFFLKIIRNLFPEKSKSLNE